MFASSREGGYHLKGVPFDFRFVPVPEFEVPRLHFMMLISGMVTIFRKTHPKKKRRFLSETDEKSGMALTFLLGRYRNINERHFAQQLRHQ